MACGMQALEELEHFVNLRGFVEGKIIKDLGKSGPVSSVLASDPPFTTRDHREQSGHQEQAHR